VDESVEPPGDAEQEDRAIFGVVYFDIFVSVLRI
jgi:hypothetical protein